MGARRVDGPRTRLIWLFSARGHSAAVAAYPPRAVSSTALRVIIHSAELRVPLSLQNRVRAQSAREAPVCGAQITRAATPVGASAVKRRQSARARKKESASAVKKRWHPSRRPTARATQHHSPPLSLRSQGGTVTPLPDLDVVDLGRPLAPDITSPRVSRRQGDARCVTKVGICVSWPGA